jgi:hypothetical protein
VNKMAESWRSMRHVKVGDEVIQHSQRQEPKTVKVEKVGSKYISISDGLQYSREDGHVKGFHGRFIITPEMAKLNMEAAVAKNELFKKGIEINGYFKYSPDTVLKIREVLNFLFSLG